MPAFAYQARDEQGRLVKGVLEADSKESLVDRLRKMGYLVTRMEEMAAGFRGILTVRLGGSVSQEALLLASIQLSNLVGAGVALIASLQAVGSQTTDRLLREAFEGLSREVEGGEPFSQALSHYPAVFPKLMVNLAAVGEASGQLDTILTRFANFIERDLALTRAVKGALLYPAVLLGAATLLILFLVAFVVPQFASLFAKAGIPLPLPTQILLVIGSALRSHGWVILPAAVGAMVGLGAAARIPTLRFRIDRFLLKIPVLGLALHQTVVARFARTLATLVESSVPIVGALETAGGVVDNQVIFQELKRVKTAVEQGERMAATLSVGKVFYPDVIQMIQVGEESGRLDTMLEKIADYYELRVNYSLKQMMTLLEPILLIVMGGVVAFIMASLLFPMFDMVKVLQHGGIR